MSSVVQKICVVTGANQGIGLSIVRQMCQQWDGVVYLTSRSEERGKKAMEQLKSEGLNPKYHQLDITDSQSIQILHNHIESNYGGLDILINNAGFAFKSAATESFGEQAQTTVDINYYGTLQVIQALRGLFKPNCRIVNVSSCEGWLGHIKSSALKSRFLQPTLTFEDVTQLMEEFKNHANNGTHRDEGWPNSTYKVSKIGVSAISRVLQREFNEIGQNQICNHLHPGYVKTSMTSNKGRMTTAEGAKSSVFAALLPEDTDIRGAYIWSDCTIGDWELKFDSIVKMYNM